MSVHACETDPRPAPNLRPVDDDMRVARTHVVALLQPRPRLPIEVDRRDHMAGIAITTNASIDVDGVISAMTILRAKRVFGVGTIATYLALLDGDGTVIWQRDSGACEVGGRCNPRAPSRRERAFFAPVSPTILSRARYLAIVHDAPNANITLGARENATFLHRAPRIVAQTTARPARTAAR